MNRVHPGLLVLLFILQLAWPWDLVTWNVNDKLMWGWLATSLRLIWGFRGAAGVVWGLSSLETNLRAEAEGPVSLGDSVSTKAQRSFLRAQAGKLWNKTAVPYLSGGHREYSLLLALMVVAFGTEGDCHPHHDAQYLSYRDTALKVTREEPRIEDYVITILDCCETSSGSLENIMSSFEWGL